MIYLHFKYLSVFSRVEALVPFLPGSYPLQILTVELTFIGHNNTEHEGSLVGQRGDLSCCFDSGLYPLKF